MLNVEGEPGPETEMRVCRTNGPGSDECVACLALVGEYDHKAGRWTSGTVDEWRAYGQLFANAPADLAYLLEENKRLRRLSELAGVSQL